MPGGQRKPARLWPFLNAWAEPSHASNAAGVITIVYDYER
jgi:hypothetical protein